MSVVVSHSPGDTSTLISSSELVSAGLSSSEPVSSSTDPISVDSLKIEWPVDVTVLDGADVAVLVVVVEAFVDADDVGFNVDVDTVVDEATDDVVVVDAAAGVVVVVVAVLLSSVVRNCRLGILNLAVTKNDATVAGPMSSSPEEFPDPKFPAEVLKCSSSSCSTVVVVVVVAVVVTMVVVVVDAVVMVVARVSIVARLGVVQNAGTAETWWSLVSRSR